MANEPVVLEKPKVEAAPPPPAPAKVEAAPPAAPVKEAAPVSEKPAWMTPPAPKEGEKPKEATPPATGEKPKEGTPPPAPAAPDKFELKAPEGTNMEAAALEKFGTEMKSLGFTQEQAQKLLERDHGAQKARVQAEQTFMKAKDKEWLGEVKNTWGTAKFAENSEHAKRGFDFLDPDGAMRKDMEAAGLAHWPKMVYAAERLGRALGEDKIGVRTETTRSVEKKNPEAALKDQYRDAAAKAAGKK